MFCGAADTPFNQVTKPHVMYSKNEKSSPLTDVVLSSNILKLSPHNLLLEALWIDILYKVAAYESYYYHILSYSSDSIFFINVYTVLFLFNNVIYVFFLL